MVPLVGFPKELKLQIEIVNRVAKEVAKETGIKLKYLVGTMIEVPRAALAADKIAEDAEFFSFGTNDLTQTALGMSRDDSGSFLPTYLEHDIIAANPFASIDQEGVGELMKMARDRAQEDPPRHQAGHLRRTWRRAEQRQVLPRHRSGLRELLAIPRAHRPPCRRAGGFERGKIGPGEFNASCRRRRWGHRC